MEDCVELRVKDIDFDRHQITVRRGKGQKDRTTTLPAMVTDPLRKHLAEVRRLQAADLKDGFGRVAEFYRDNASVIDQHRVPTLDFDTGTETARRYTRAKIIDMIFFVEGGE